MAHKMSSEKLNKPVGQKFGRVFVVKFSHRNERGHIFYLCRCECGTEWTTARHRLLNGSTKSCGCFCRDTSAALKTTHGYAYRAEYRAWNGILNRCRCKGDVNYHRYGGRGIRVCKRWLKFENFIADMGDRPSAKHSIDRIDNNGNYEPSNCRWATMKEQGRNRSDNVNITYKGETKCVSAWAEERGMVMNTIRLRLQRGWSVERAIETPA